MREYNTAKNERKIINVLEIFQKEKTISPFIKKNKPGIIIKGPLMKRMLIKTYNTKKNRHFSVAALLIQSL